MFSVFHNLLSITLVPDMVYSRFMLLFDAFASDKKGMKEF